ncbi:MAG: SDR family NAD(P)-dependent oxidoreductase, partial [Micromonosporaceae bacterium]
MKFEGKTVIVTGAGRNVGQAIARRFVEEGATAAVVDLDPERGEATAEQLNALRVGSARFFGCDVSSPLEVPRMVNEVTDAFGGVDVLVNNVAITDRGRSVLELDYELWRRVLAVTLDSVFLCSKH